MSDTFWQFAVAFGPIVLPVIWAITVALYKYTLEGLPTRQRAFLQNIVYTCVAAVEQRGSDMTSAQKKALAFDFIHANLNHFKVRVPDAVIESFLEEAVLVIGHKPLPAKG